MKYIHVFLILIIVNCKTVVKNNDLEKINSFTIKLDKKYGYFDRAYSEILNNLKDLVKFNPVFGNKIDINGNKFTIAIEDVNRNGVFNTNVDNLHLAGYDDNNVYRFSECSNSVSLLKNSNNCLINNENFIVEVVDSINQIISIKKSNIKLNSDIYYNYFIPKELIVKDLLTKEDTNLATSQKKYQYFYFWGSWCSGCHVQATLLKQIYEKYPNIEIIGMNCKEVNVENAIKYVSKNNVKWRNVISNRDVNRYFHQNGYPDGTLYKDGKLLKANITPMELMELCNKGI